MIRKFLDRQFTEAYFQSQFSCTVSDVKFKFLTRDLSMLLIAPVDLAHYASLLKALKEYSTEDSLAKFGYLITEDVERVLKRYTT